jgi:hypothetical protein
MQAWKEKHTTANLSRLLPSIAATRATIVVVFLVVFMPWCLWNFVSTKNTAGYNLRQSLQEMERLGSLSRSKMDRPSAMRRQLRLQLTTLNQTNEVSHSTPRLYALDLYRFLKRNNLCPAIKSIL